MTTGRQLSLATRQKALQYVFNTCWVEGVMQKKLTITLHEEVYAGLHNVVGRRRISQFIESLVRPHVLGADLEEGYRQMAEDEAHEIEALVWAEATTGDAGDGTR